MDPKTVQLITYIESLAALTAETVVELKNLVSGNSTKTADAILDDADAKYKAVIAAAK